MSTEAPIQEMELCAIARVIREDWKPVHPTAAPYVEALECLRTMDDAYGADDGRYVVAYLVANLSTWRGPVAREVKAELRRRLAS